jgi:predicted nucleic acid-binding protein
LLDKVAVAGAVVPPLWRLEVANGFQSGIRRKRMDVAYRDASIADLRKLPITVDPDTDAHIWTTTLSLSDRYGLTIYDACYLELAQRRDLPLATLDQELRAAGKALGLALLGR